jgi:hypothetical protein
MNESQYSTCPGFINGKKGGRREDHYSNKGEFMKAHSICNAKEALVPRNQIHDLKLDKLVTKKLKREDISDVADETNKRRWVCGWN